MHDLLIHELGARRIHWRYDDPSGLPDLPARGGAGAVRPPRAAGELRLAVRRLASPKAA
jgi:hypothetical protein